MDESLIKDIIGKAKNLDLSALEVLCEHFYHRIYNYIFFKVSSRPDAEDLTSEVFIRMVKSIAQQSGDFKTWLYKIASNMVIDHYRQKASIKKTMSRYEEFLQLDNQKSNNRNSGDYDNLFYALTQEQHEVVALRFVDGFNVSEISKIMQKSENAVKALQFRAMVTLREKFKKQPVNSLITFELLENQGVC
ncbi:MAG: sigma-70 family RNA polymerase sigma factor [Elusimicrobia bacterium]|nr:sigma-70 family RNA polymerase sigma factor [Elusimicrobiota bacterium]MBU2614638.1 sigma-70 family RNA polymerase sigma factor [Elusimicrobiota bacterium]